MTDLSERHNMVLSRVFDASIEQVWRAWSDSDLLKRWWGPAGFTCPVAEMDFREGGKSLVCMRAAEDFGGQQLCNTWTYQKIVPGERIEFVQHFVDQAGRQVEPVEIGLPPEIPIEVPHRLALIALNDRQTELTVTEYGYPTAQIVELSRAGMDQSLDKLAAILSAPEQA